MVAKVWLVLECQNKDVRKADTGPLTERPKRPGRKVACETERGQRPLRAENHPLSLAAGKPGRIVYRKREKETRPMPHRHVQIPEPAAYVPQGLPPRAPAERLFPVRQRVPGQSGASGSRSGPREEVWSVQERILNSIRDNKNTAVTSCHGSRQVHTSSPGPSAGGWTQTWHALGLRPSSVTTAPSWSQVSAILWRYIRKLHGKMGLPGPRHAGLPVAHVRIRRRPALQGRGTRPKSSSRWAVSRPTYDENALQGIHARYVLGVIDEANGVPKQLFDGHARPSPTNDTSRVIAIRQTQTTPEATSLISPGRAPTGIRSASQP